jgi:hypothetical protein
MKLRRGAALALILMSSACATNHPVWLIAAPMSSDFPEGQADAPLSKWARIRGYDYLDDCKSRLLDAQNRLQRPVICVAVDNPQLRNN